MLVNQSLVLGATYRSEREGDRGLVAWLDLEHVTHFNAGIFQSPCRQLDHRLTAKHPARDSPGLEIFLNGDYLILSVQKNYIDSKPHEPHVNKVARRQDQSLTWLQSASAEKPHRTRNYRIGHLPFIGDELSSTGIGDFKV